MTDTSSAGVDVLRQVTLRQRLAVAVEYGWRVERDANPIAAPSFSHCKSRGLVAAVIVLTVLAAAILRKTLTGRRRADLTPASGDADGQTVRRS